MDAAVDSLFFYQEPFLDLLVLKVSAHEVYMRLLAFVLAVVFALVAGVLVAKHRRTAESLRDSGREWQNTFDSISDAICVLDPSAICKAKSSLPLRATMTAVACSAALPTKGMRIRPTKV